MTRALAIALILLVAPAAQAVELLEQRGDSPLITFRILVRTGAASDPEGQEGVAALTAAMLAASGSERQSYDEIIQTLFPLASSLAAQVDKEMTVFSGTTHLENLDAYYDIVRAVLLEPGWREEDFERVRDDALNFLRTSLRSNNEEELGKEFLYLAVYGPKHPYGHHNGGTIASLEALTVEDLKAFYSEHYRRDAITVALAGRTPDGFAQSVVADFETLPEGAAEPPELAAPAAAAKLRVHIIEKDTRSTLISIGFPLDVVRSDPDWPALKLTQSYFGQHRSAKSHLYQRIRKIRGMNYGDYAYIEYFPRGMFQTQPDANLARRQQIFQIWIRPVQPENGLFALKIALYELDKLVLEGISEEHFEATRLFLSKNVNLLTQTQSDQLGVALDSRAYGLPDFNGWIKEQLAGLTSEKVNAAVAKHLRASDLDIVVITQDAQAFRRQLLSKQPAKMRYASPPPDEILQEDKIIGAYKLDLGQVEIVPVGTIFE